MSAMSHEIQEAFVHTADEEAKTVCGVAIDDTLPVGQRLRRLYTQSPYFNDSWIDCSAHNKCERCEEEIVRRQNERRTEYLRIEKRARAAEIAKRAADVPVWRALYTLSQVDRYGFDAVGLDELVKEADRHFADPRHTMIKPLTALEAFAERVTAEVIKRERERLAIELAKEAEQMAQRYAINIPGAYSNLCERDAATEAFARASAIALGGEIKP